MLNIVHVMQDGARDAGMFATVYIAFQQSWQTQPQLRALKLLFVAGGAGGSLCIELKTIILNIFRPVWMPEEHSDPKA